MAYNIKCTACCAINTTCYRYYKYLYTYENPKIIWVFSCGKSNLQIYSFNFYFLLPKKLKKNAGYFSIAILEKEKGSKKQGNLGIHVMIEKNE